MTRLDEQIKKEVRNVKKLNESDNMKEVNKARKEIQKEWKKAYKIMNSAFKKWNDTIQEKYKHAFEEGGMDNYLWEAQQAMYQLDSAIELSMMNYDA